ncbi:two-component system response regulator YesN [Paenibacillus cellulosilyticus]|uniref:Two-component system response regulator YesN n=1 Tax=Paenibacillus cellulosilyticus TaxID=375489 RepID=A0A2V2YSD2_9BACL|nr:response regulator [Paenibacillus cellulosilyticus]PWW01118.1 two-component system response regulator YesN [Paenibacillus cellulosilyticus]QKS46913.1 response regulator [Paenibacillus cellulosilyticus]
MRLLIVDDGQYIVEYLKHLLDWRKIGIEHVQTTTNPQEAKRILASAQVDILLTDIRMPEISGVDLLKWLHERQSSCKVIFLSGYSDFEYTQSAIRYGAADYLLKPVDKNEMEKTIVRAVQAVKKDRPTAVTEPSELDGAGFLLAVLADNHQLQDRLAAVPQSLSSESFVFVQAIQPSSESMQSLLRDTSGPLNQLVWVVDGMCARMVALLPQSYAQSLSVKNDTLLMSGPFLLQERNSARSEYMRFYYREKISLTDSIFMRNLQKDWVLKPDEWESNKKSMQKLFLSCQSRSRQLLFLIELVSRLYAIYPKLAADQAACWLFHPLEATEAIFSDILAAVSQLERPARQSGQDIVTVIQAYILDHLDKPLNLEEIASLVHLHPVYLSKYYKQETDENLSSFLLAQRMKKAAQLLQESALHIVDISQMVGYKKSQHFIKLFKEEYGITPYQYRRMHIADGS